MNRRPPPRRQTGEQSREGWACVQCGTLLTREQGWRFSDSHPPVHCNGSRFEFRSAYATRNGEIHVPHHGHTPHADCWMCSAPMGCSTCAGSHPVCTRCEVHTSVAGFSVSGPITNVPAQVQRRGGTQAPEFGEYPAAFQAAYRRVQDGLPTPPPAEERRISSLLPGIGKEMP